MLGGELNRFAHMKSRTARRSRQIIGHHVGIDAEHLNVTDRNSQLLAGDLRHYGLGALAHLDGAGINR